MEQRFTVDVEAAPEPVFELVADLDRYPEWLDLVHKVERAAAGDGPAAWWVTLRAVVGPFARSKRLRMLRTADEAPHWVRFERAEVDGRDHSAWILESEVCAAGDGSSVTMTLRYDGRLWSPVLGGVLERQVARATENLRSLATG
ncbi:MAG: SRPBCC family protein [Acidimicrobiales bacterium]